MNFLQSKLGPFPVWVWGLVVIGGVVVFIIVRKMQNGNTSGTSTLGQNSAGQVNPLNPTNDPNLDPNTGIPYQIEEAIDPNTGLPYYLELTNGATSPGQAGGGPQGATAAVPSIPSGPTGPAQPYPAPTSGPGTAPGTMPASPYPGGPTASPPVLSYPGASPGTIPITGAGGNASRRGTYPGSKPGTPPGPMPPTPVPPHKPGGGPMPPTPVPGHPGGPMPPKPIGTGDEESPWTYPFWSGQGGTLYSGV